MARDLRKRTVTKPAVPARPQTSVPTEPRRIVIHLYTADVPDPDDTPEDPLPPLHVAGELESVLVESVEDPGGKAIRHRSQARGAAECRALLTEVGISLADR